MNSSSLRTIDEGVRSIVLICVAGAYLAWDIGFELGAYGRVTFDKIFIVWSVSLALLIVSAIIPKRILPVPAPLWFATAVPFLWLCIAMVNRAAPDEVMIRYLLTILGMIAVLACFPYVAFVLMTILYPDFANIAERRVKYAVLVTGVLMVCAGYFIGTHHERFITCEDFEISGEYIPEDCGDPS